MNLYSAVSSREILETAVREEAPECDGARERGDPSDKQCRTLIVGILARITVEFPYYIDRLASYNRCAYQTFSHYRALALGGITF